MTALNKVTLEANNDNVFTSNGNRGITGLILNNFITDMIDSMPNEVDGFSASLSIVTPVGNLTSINVQLALQELQSDIDTKLTEKELGTITVADEYTPTKSFTEILDIQVGQLPVNLVRTTFNAGVIAFLDGATINEPIKVLGIVDNS